MIKFYYCDSLKTYQDNQSQISDNDIAVIKGQKNLGMLKIMQTQIGYNEVWFGGIFNYSTDFIEETSISDADSNLYYLDKLGCFGCGTIEEVTGHNSNRQYPYIKLVFKGQTKNFPPLIADILKSVAEYKDGKFYPLPNTIYQAVRIESKRYDKEGIKYLFTEGSFCPLFTLEPGDCLLSDGTVAKGKDAINNHINAIIGIIVDPIRKTYLPNPSISIQQPIVGDASAATLQSYINFGVIDNCVDYEDKMNGLIYYAFNNKSDDYKKYFPAFNAARDRHNFEQSYIYPVTLKELKCIKETPLIQEVIQAINDKSPGNITVYDHSISPAFNSTDARYLVTYGYNTSTQVKTITDYTALKLYL